MKERRILPFQGWRLVLFQAIVVFSLMILVIRTGELQFVRGDQFDQDAQENFFHPERQDRRRTGAGGVPVRSADDYLALYAASRRGNFPLMRSYSGTANHLRYAEMLVRTIDNAWCATSLFWFNAMDGRGPHDLETSIRFHQELLAGKVVLQACPKLDDAEFYIDKLTTIFSQNHIRSLTVARMEVPCCGGLLAIVGRALEASGRDIPVEVVVIGISGDVLDRQAYVPAGA